MTMEGLGERVERIVVLGGDAHVELRCSVCGDDARLAEHTTAGVLDGMQAFVEDHAACDRSPSPRHAWSGQRP